MTKYTYFEIKDKMTELDFTNDLFNYLTNAKREVDYALTYNRGVLDEDAEFRKKLMDVFHELDGLGRIALKAYNHEREKLLKKMTEKEVNE